MAKDIDDILLSKKQWFGIYRELREIYMSTFKWKNLPDTVNARYIEKSLLEHNQLAFYKEPIVDGFVCLQSTTTGKLDIYGDPVYSMVYGVNGFSRQLKPDTFVTIWDNLDRYNVKMRLMQFAKRIYNMERTIDVNILQQKTPRIIKATKETELSVKTLLRDVDDYKEKIVTIDGFNDNIDVDVILAPAPFVADKIRIEKRELWNEVLSFIGILNNSSEKSERLVADEVIVSSALALIKRSARQEARQQGIDRINKKWGLDIELKINPEVIQAFNDSILKSIYERGVDNGEVHGGTE